MVYDTVRIFLLQNMAGREGKEGKERRRRAGEMVASFQGPQPGNEAREIEEEEVDKMAKQDTYVHSHERTQSSVIAFLKEHEVLCKGRENSVTLFITLHNCPLLRGSFQSEA